MRIGQGFSICPLCHGERLLLGGVVMRLGFAPQDRSDGDIVSRALADGLLGAAGLGAYEDHFSQTNPAYASASGLSLLSLVNSKIKSQGLAMISADLNLFYADREALQTHIVQMRLHLSEQLAMPAQMLNLKVASCSTGPWLENAMAASAVVLINESGK